MLTKTSLLHGVKWLLTGVLVIALMRKIDARQIVATLAVVQFPSLSFAIILTFLVVAVDSYKLKISLSVLSPDVSVSWWTLIKIYYIALFISILLPGGQLTGESVKAYKLFAHCSKKQAILSVGVDKALGLNALLCVTWALMVADVAMPFTALRDLFLGLFAMVSLGMMLAFSVNWARMLHTVARRLPSPRLQPLFNHAIAFADIIAHASASSPRLLQTFLCASLSQGLGVLSMYAFAHSAHLPVSPQTIGWMFGALGIIQLFPFTVAGIGLREVSYAFFLTPYGINVNQTMAFCLALYLILPINAIIGGGIYLSEHRQKHAITPESPSRQRASEQST